MKKKLLIIFSLILFFFGIFFLFKSNIPVTGAVVGVSNSSSASSIFGIMLIFVSILILIAEESLEERLNIKSFKRKIEKLERRKIHYDEAKTGYKNQSIRELALSRKVPLDEAVKMHNDADNKVETGEWVELARSRDTDYATGESYRHDFKSGGSLQEASSYRFFGPKKILRDYQRGEIKKRLKNQSSIKKQNRKNIYQIAREVVKEVKSLPESKAERYFREGIIPGKIHELFGGYEHHGECGGNYEKTSSGWKRKSFEGPIRKGENKFSNYSPPGESLAGAIHHRHWELINMYRYSKRKKRE